MITTENAKTMPWHALDFAREDLQEVIAAQEKIARDGGAHLVPKLGAYWDELYAVSAEIKRRTDHLDAVDVAVGAARTEAV